MRLISDNHVTKAEGSSSLSSSLAFCSSQHIPSSTAPLPYYCRGRPSASSLAPSTSFPVRLHAASGDKSLMSQHLSPCQCLNSICNLKSPESNTSLRMLSIFCCHLSHQLLQNPGSHPQPLNIPHLLALPEIYAPSQLLLLAATSLPLQVGNGFLTAFALTPLSQPDDFLSLNASQSLCRGPQQSPM